MKNPANICVTLKNLTPSYIPCLKVRNDKNEEITISEQKQIDLELTKFYGNLHESQESNNTGTIDDFLEQQNLDSCPKVPESDAIKLEGLITVDEATSYVKRCRADASPGSSGFTGGFIIFF